MLIMNGKEFEFDLFELETTKKYEKAFQDVVEKMKNMDEETMLSEAIVIQCDAIRACVDEIFGEGTGIAVCGENYNLTKHMDAFDALVDEAAKQRAVYDNQGSRFSASAGA